MLEGKKPKKLWIIFWSISNISILIGLFLAYGPISYFRELYITSAMATFKHQYLAKVFYSDKTIQTILNNNFIKEAGTETDESKISFVESDSGVYASEYEKQILKRDKDALYKIIDITGSGYVGKIVAIYDPSRIKIGTASKMGEIGETISTIGKKHKAIIAINASGYDDPNWMGNGGTPTGVVIQNGKIIYSGNGTGVGGGLIGFTKDNVLRLTREDPELAIKKGMRDAITFGPFLIVNGEAAFIKGNGGWGIAPRTAIAQRKDGIVLFLLIDGRKPGYSIGADMVEVTKVLQNYGAYNAANLDGGASTGLAVNGKLFNKPCAATPSGERYLPNAWILK